MMIISWTWLVWSKGGASFACIRSCPQLYCVRRLKPLSRGASRGVEFTVEDPGITTQVPVDCDQLQHAMQNLLENALAHTPAGGRITLAAESTPGHVVFSVSDTGSGIPAEYLPMIFQRHFRVPGDTTPGGSGLG